ncbi:hypothetical protein IC801_17130 [Geobacillus sp. 44B]|nr:hypothetical protein IC801_17130 [Geobacillus sp. 44B]
MPLDVIMNMKPLHMGTVNKDGELALVLLQTHPRQLILSKSWIRFCGCFKRREPNGQNSVCRHF